MSRFTWMIAVVFAVFLLAGCNIGDGVVDEQEQMVIDGIVDVIEDRINDSQKDDTGDPVVVPPVEPPTPEPDPEPVLVTEYPTYFGITNGNMPTWYFSRNVPAGKYTVYVKNILAPTEINYNGSRWDSGNCIMKASEVYGRGTGLFCRVGKSTEAWIKY